MVKLPICDTWRIPEKYQKYKYRNLISQVFMAGVKIRKNRKAGPNDPAILKGIK
jgi:hypothetical protein